MAGTAPHRPAPPRTAPYRTTPHRTVPCFQRKCRTFSFCQSKVGSFVITPQPVTPDDADRHHIGVQAPIRIVRIVRIRRACMWWQASSACRTAATWGCNGSVLTLVGCERLFARDAVCALPQPNGVWWHQRMMGTSLPPGGAERRRDGGGRTLGNSEIRGKMVQDDADVIVEYRRR